MADEVEREPTFVLAIAVLANLGDWLRAAIPDRLRARLFGPTFILVMPPGMTAGESSQCSQWRGVAPTSSGPAKVAKVTRITHARDCARGCAFVTAGITMRMSRGCGGTDE